MVRGGAAGLRGGQNWGAAGEVFWGAMKEMSSRFHGLEEFKGGCEEAVRGGGGEGTRGQDSGVCG